MAKFTGKYIDFEKFIGPRMRNIVQTGIGRTHKKTINSCEGQNCNNNLNLELAHVHGFERRKLIRMACTDFIRKSPESEETLENLDLIEFERRFRELHEPLKERLKVLCRNCHRIYDKINEEISIIPEIFQEANNDHNTTLKINLYPEDKDEFKELLLIHKKAYININFTDGTKIVKVWDASNFTDSSDVINNLRSRQEFRNGNWQNKGIDNVEIEILFNI